MRHSTRVYKTHVWHNDYFTVNVMKHDQPNGIQSHVTIEINPDFACFMSQAMEVTEPRHFRDAICQDQWVASMNEELHALEINNTWDITTLPPKKKTNWVQMVIQNKV